MGKESEEKKPEPKKTKPRKIESSNKGGCIKKLAILSLFLFLTYVSLHLWFLWQPAGETDDISNSFMDANVAGFPVFPALKAYSMDHIEGRKDILDGKSIDPPMIAPRMKTAVERNFPVTFTEEEVNHWLSKRVVIKQGGMIEPFVKARGVWVDFKEDQIEIIIEREFQGRNHVTSMFLNFTRSKQGYSIRRDSSHVGQVSPPGGFARLIMGAFHNLADELEEEMKLYDDGKIRDIHVEEGKITLDPRRPQDRL